jgi:SAM-dependent methyltransferase
VNRPPAERQVTPEILDRLPPSDSRAQQSRRDLQKINFFMGHARLLGGSLQRATGPRPIRRVAELGCGDGTLMLRIAKRLGRRVEPVAVEAIDRQPSIAAETIDTLRSLNWHVTSVRSDVFAWLQTDALAYDAIFANLFLHHFGDDALRSLFRALATRTRWFAACEPWRSRSALTGVSLLPVIGCNDVTLHDGRVSVNAGFKDRELTALWPAGAWDITETRSGLFSHFFEARHVAPF